MRASIQGVELPFDLAEFITPDWDPVLRHYSRFAREVRASGREPYAIQPYMLEFAKAVEQACAKSGCYERLGSKVYKTADEIMGRYFEHFGILHFAQMVEAAKASVDLAAESEAFRSKLMTALTERK